MTLIEKILEKSKITQTLPRQALGEFLGTFVLIIFGCASAAQVKTSRETKGQFLAGNIAFSVGVMAAMYLCRGVSGGHLNPAVSLSFCVLGKLPWKSLLPYTLAQIFGAYLASALVFAIYRERIIAFGNGILSVTGENETASIFATYPDAHVTMVTSFLDQVVGTAMLLLCILPLIDKRNAPAPDAFLPPMVATVVLGITLSMSANCGAAINPARDFGPRLFTLTAGWGTEVFTSHNCFFWIPIVAPMFGGVLGSFLYLAFIQWHLPESEEE